MAVHGMLFSYFGDGAEQNSDDSGVDAPLTVTPKTLQTALKPAFQQTGAVDRKQTGQADQVLAGYEAAARQADATWATTSPANSTVEPLRVHAAEKHS